MLKVGELISNKITNKFRFYLKATSEIASSLSNQTIFSGLTPSQLRKIEDYVTVKTITPNNEVNAEGFRVENALCCVLSGKVNVYEPEGKKEIIECQAGEPINLLSLVDETAKARIVSAAEPTTLLILQLEDLRVLPYYKKVIEPILLANAVRFFADRFSHTKEILLNINRIGTSSLESHLDEIQRRVLFGIFIIRILIVLCMYTLSLKGLAFVKLEVGSSSGVTILLVSFVAMILYHIMLQTRLPMSNFGITTTNWKNAIQVNLFFSIAFIIVSTFAKYVFIHFHPASLNMPLFEWKTGMHATLQVYDIKLFLFFVLYMAFSPIQEFIVRGGLQGALYSFLSGTEKERRWTSIIVSNLMFTTLHIHLSTSFALMAFIPGVFWGWSYARQKTLIGVSLSHAITGAFLFYILGITNIIPQ